MKASVKKIDGNKREIDIQVDGEIVKDKFEEAFKKIAQSAKVPGFRVGHAPRDILEKNFSDSAQELVLKELVPDIYNQAIDQQKLDVVELPSISDVKLDRNSLSFKATVEVMPEIKLSPYKGIKLKHHKIEVTAEEIKRSLDALKESRKADSLDDNFARSLGYPNLAELQGVLERQIYLEKENQQRQKIENGVIETLLKDLNFSLPESLVKRQKEDLLRQVKLDLALKGLPEDKIAEEEKRLNPELEPQAKKQVKVYLVLAEIAKRENIPLDQYMPRKVMEFLLKEADWQEEN